MHYKPECIIRTNNNRIVCKEKQKEVVFINEKRRTIEKVLVDGCQIKDGQRCDYLVIWGNIQNFIELKGKKIYHAVEQVKRSIQLLGMDDYQKKCYIVLSRSPIMSSEIQNLMLNFKKNLKTSLVVKNKKINVKID